MYQPVGLLPTGFDYIWIIITLPYHPIESTNYPIMDWTLPWNFTYFLSINHILTEVNWHLFEDFKSSVMTPFQDFVGLPLPALPVTLTVSILLIHRSARCVCHTIWVDLILQMMQGRVFPIFYTVLQSWLYLWCKNSKSIHHCLFVRF